MVLAYGSHAEAFVLADAYRRAVRRFGERLVPKLYAHLNPMTYAQALKMEQQLAEELRAAGYLVFGGH